MPGDTAMNHAEPSAMPQMELASSQRGWAIAQSNASEQVRISCRPTWSTWKKTIVVSAEEQARVAQHDRLSVVT
jgi:hypothetical protein